MMSLSVPVEGRGRGRDVLEAPALKAPAGRAGKSSRDLQCYAVGEIQSVFFLPQPFILPRVS